MPHVSDSIRPCPRVRNLSVTAHHAPRTLSRQVILKECDDALSKRSDVPIRKDRVCHLLSLLETPLDHRPLWAELSSYLLPVATKKDPTLLFRKSQSSTLPSSFAIAK